MRFFDLDLFMSTFPNYSDFKVPMWSSWREDEAKENVILKIAVPGYDVEDFELFVEDDSLFLSIKGKKTTSYWLLDNKELNLEAATADYKAGVLKVKIPKLETKKGKKLQIKVS